MRKITSVAAMQSLARTCQRQGTPVAFVPTMGYLHEGHASLIRRGRTLAGRQGKVVVSIFVNPTQFAVGEDFARYPRDLARDSKLSREAGADVIFVPSATEMYPAFRGAAFSTYVVEETLSQSMEGRSRPTHFRGVTTVVAKLFNIVQPQWAIFGAKDFQQAAVVGRMIRDLNFPIRLVVAPTVREKDGVAMSSRNKYLEGQLRSQARALWQAITRARKAVRSSKKPLAARALQQELRRLIELQPEAKVDYVSFFAPENLVPAGEVRRGTQLALAVKIGNTRLIDNARL